MAAQATPVLDQLREREFRTEHGRKGKSWVGLGLCELGEVGEANFGDLSPVHSLRSSSSETGSRTSRNSQLVLAAKAPPWVDTSDQDEEITWTS